VSVVCVTASDPFLSEIVCLSMADRPIRDCACSARRERARSGDAPTPSVTQERTLQFCYVTAVALIHCSNTNHSLVMFQTYLVEWRRGSV